MSKKLTMAALFVLGFAMTSTAAPKNKAPAEIVKTKLVLMGNDVGEGPYMPEMIWSEFGNSIKPGGPVLVISWTPYSESYAVIAVKKVWVGYGSYSNADAIFATKAPENEAERLDLIEKIKNAGAIFITGPMEDVLMKGLSQPGVSEAIRAAYNDGVVVAGAGAGARIMGTDTMIQQTRREQSDRILRVIPGLGLIKLSGAQATIVDDNFANRQMKAMHDGYGMEYGYAPPPLLKGMREHKAMGIAIDQGTALTLTNGSKLSVLTDYMNASRKVNIFTDWQQSMLKLTSVGTGYYVGHPELQIGHKESINLDVAKPGLRLCRNIFN